MITLIEKGKKEKRNKNQKSDKNKNRLYFLFNIKRNSKLTNSKNGASRLSLIFLVFGGGPPVDLSDQIEENFVDVDFEFGGGLKEGAVELLGEALSLVLPDHALVLEVALVPHQHHGDVIGVFHSQDLFPQVHEVVEGALGSDGVDEDESLAVLHVEVAHGRELLRARRVQDLQHALLSVDFNLFPI